MGPRPTIAGGCLALLLGAAGACGSEPAPSPPPAPEPPAPPAPEPVPDPPAVEPPPPGPAVIRVTPTHEDAIDARVREALAAGAAPGCVVAVGRADGVVFARAYGRRAIEPEPEPMTLDTIFDLASVTKAVATATSAMILIERGELSLDTRASSVIEGLTGGGRERITVEHLLTHTAGFPAVNSLRDYEGERDEVIARIARVGLEHPPGARVRYSDLSFIVLGEVIARVTGRGLDRFAREAIFEPLGMRETLFAPPAALRPRIAPTERAPRRGDVIIRGEVHDPRAWRLGGVAGNAGLFSTAADLSRFARAMLSGGALDGARILEASTVAEMTRRRPLPNGSRALGWDVGRAGMSARAFGHGGFTGTSLWIDPERDVFLVFLSNRVHPDGDGDVQPLLRALVPLVVEAASASLPPREAPVSTGLDVLVRDGFERLAGRRVAVLTHRAARTRDGRRALRVLHAAPEVEVVRALAPEHGLGVDREGTIGDGRDPVTGVEVMGLFGPRRDPTDEMLAGIDTVVVDLQDVGVRFYTYASTVRRLLEAASERGLRVVILDRPDPLGGGPPRGPVSEPALASFVNHHPLPAIHGMTLGELATLLNAERGIGAELEVVELEGWDRTPWPATGLRWVPSSPNLRTPEAVALYPALALLEGTNLSVGRGTERPFEQIGAPFVDGDALAEALSDLPGVEVEPTRFTPRASRHRGERCEGVALTVTDPARYRPIRTGLAIARALRELHPDAWEPERMERMLGRRAVYRALLEGEPVEALERRWAPGLREFEALRERYLRYRAD